MPTTVVGSCGIAYHLIGSFNFICNLDLYQFGIPPHSGGTRQYHSLSSADGIGGKAMVAGRNALTWMGGIYSSSPPGAKGYNHVFYGTPYCPTCSVPPSKRK